MKSSPNGWRHAAIPAKLGATKRQLKQAPRLLVHRQRKWAPRTRGSGREGGPVALSNDTDTPRKWVGQTGEKPHQMRATKQGRRKKWIGPLHQSTGTLTRKLEYLLCQSRIVVESQKRLGWKTMTLSLFMQKVWNVTEISIRLNKFVYIVCSNCIGIVVVVVVVVGGGGGGFYFILLFFLK